MKVCPSFPLSDEAFVSHEVGVPSAVGDGAEGAGVFELAAAPPVWPPAVGALFSLFDFEQAAVAITIAISRNGTSEFIR